MCSNNMKNMQRCMSAVTTTTIIILIGVLVLVMWLFNSSALSTNHFKENNNNMSPAVTVIERIQLSNKTNATSTSRGKIKEYKQSLRKSDLKKTKIPEEEYVKPLKIDPPNLTEHDIIFDKLNNNHGKPPLPHHSGHFRHKWAEVWDPHPSYEIDAFGKTLILHLELDKNFIAPNLHITTFIHQNFTQRVKHDQRMANCFYKGTIQNDANSAVSVSLCHGMIGHIRTSDANYYIEPVKFSNNTLDSFLHKIRREPLPVNRDGNNKMGSSEIPVDCEINETHTIVEDDFLSEVVEHRPQAHPHNIKKRDIYFDDIDTEVIDGPTFGDFELQRSPREVEWVRNYGKRSNEYFIKLLVVADKTMVEYHRNEDDLTHYIFTIMSHVALLYKDATVGNAISVAVNHIKILREGDFSNSNSQDMLRQFCEWQEKHTKRGSHDAALLLTRDTICKNSSANMCNTLGVAQVASMCSPSSACAIVRDKGLSTSYTVAHEIGHLLSMPHDDDKKCDEFNKGYIQNNIMSKRIQNDTKFWMWSACSKHFVTEFLDSSKSKCLLNHPSMDFIPLNYMSMLPGESFEINTQCQLEFGVGSRLCSDMPYCGSLWCTTERGEQEGCKTQFLPWAEGTTCGRGRWCHHGKCVPVDRRLFIPTDGGWGPWQAWGPCSRSCGGGVKLSKRYCDSPVPQNGGAYCTGRSIRYASCNTMDCDLNEPDFRAIQCAEFNGNSKNLPNLTSEVKWVPKYGLDQPEDVCRLYCRPKNSNAYYLLKEKVLDGTKCGLTSFDICVNGICRPGGCDNRLESKMVLDDCGICGGDNSRCEEITGQYNISVLGYNHVVRIPKGSSNIDIQQRGILGGYNNDDNYLALIDGETGSYILNGNYMALTQKTDVVFGSLIIAYSGSNASVETIKTAKNHKLSKDLVVEVLSVGKVTPPDITYRYVISQDSAPKFGWRLYQKDWSKCNSICSGQQFIQPICVELATNNIVAEHNCAQFNKKSFTQQRDCNMHCQLTWNIKSKGVCSAQCGKGIRRVYYNCMKVYTKKQLHSELVDDKHCVILPKPPESETCTTVCDSTHWEYSNWSECSKTCGSGTQRRTARCVDNNTIMDDSYCKNNEKVTEQICNTNKCPVWAAIEQPSCSVPCGGGYKNITLYCHVDGRIQDHSACDQSLKPPSTQPCNEQACVAWVPTPWACSVTCGIGIESRNFVCRSVDTKEVVNEKYCKDQGKPTEERRTCKMDDCDIFQNPYHIRPKVNDINDNSINNYDRLDRYRWIATDWSECSKTCGGGTSYQIFKCRNEFSEENEVFCSSSTKPSLSRRCNQHSCPKWKTGDYSPTCDAHCEKHRQVRCVNHQNEIITDDKCNTKEKPESSTVCKLSECPHVTNTLPRRYFDARSNKEKRYRWKVGKYKPCSNFCGIGTRRRTVDCEDTLNEIIVVDSLCNNTQKSKPKSTKQCERFNCKYAWKQSHWSSCSATCGPGIQTRNVTCHRVHHGGIVDPTPLPDIYSNKIQIHHKNYCSLSTKPATTTKCLLSHCTDQYIWQPGPWNTCSHKCGKRGRQIRHIYCLNVKTKEPVPRYYCPKSLRPKRKRKCNQWRCLHKSCKDIQIATGSRENKDYMISIRGRPAKIYCFKMDTPHPEEFISLHPDSMNYAESYDKRLIDINTCPYGGQRNDSCSCIDMSPERSGLTRFWKVRINTTSLEIIGDDYTFSKQVRGKEIPFGTAGDCYSGLRGCPQGRFSIDLMETSFRLTSNVQWQNIGREATSVIHRSETGASGKCGGNCGSCIPHRSVGLQVEIT